MKIVSVDKVYLDPKHIRELKKLGDVVIYNDVPDEIEGIKRIKDADIVIDNWFEMPATVISAAPKLKLIAVAATGYDWIDISAAKKHNIVVCNAPGYSTGSVAEHTIGLLLRAIRLASRAEADLRAGKWNPTTYKGKELSGKTLGIIGYGAIGKRVAKIAKNGFGMRIL
ncbi:MAG: NAD(P)-dependent oxidoreductase, partial [Patescibacteria group bacterium]